MFNGKPEVFDNGEFRDSVCELFRQRLTTGSSNMAAQTGNTYICGTIRDRIEISTTNLQAVFNHDEFKKVDFGGHIVSGFDGHIALSGCSSLSLAIIRGHIFWTRRQEKPRRCGRGLIMFFSANASVRNVFCRRLRCTEDIDVKIDGPAKADVAKKEEKDGIMTYVYVPISAGEYNINIRFKNKHIHGSPFSAKISGSLHFIYTVAHKKWTISFRCLQRVCHAHTENFFNMPTIPKTLIKMLFNTFTLRCSNWSKSFPKLSNRLINQIKSIRRKHVYLWHHEWCQKEYLTWTILQRMLILYHLRVLSLASTFYKNETVVEQQFT